MKSSTFWDITSFSPLNVCLLPAFTLVSSLVYSLILKIEATCSSETSVDFQRTAPQFCNTIFYLHIRISLKYLFHFELP
jgi:ABC-type multidrug transport system permease subunit